MTATALSPDELETAHRMGEDGRHADVLAHLAKWPEEVEKSPSLSLLYGTAHARLGRNAEGLRWVENALRSARIAGDSAVERRALNARGAIALATGRPEEGADYFTQGLIAACRDNDLRGIGRCANNVGIVASTQGRHAEALSSYAMAVVSFEQAGLHTGVAECQHNLGITYRQQGRLDLALASAIRAGDAALASGDQNLAALVLRGRAEIRLLGGDLGMAGREVREALKIHCDLGDPVQVAGDQRVMAGVLVLEGRRQEAETMLRDVVAKATALDRPQLAADALRDLALLLHGSGRGREAREAARAARAMYARIGAEFELRRLAEHDWDQEFGDELRQSLRPLHTAQRMADAGHYAELLGYLGRNSHQELERSPTLLLLKAVGHARLGHMHVALQWAFTALTRARALGDRALEVRALNVSGAIALERGGISEAIQYFTLAQEEAMLEGDMTTVGRAANNLGVIANMQGEFGRAVGAFTMAIAAYQRTGNDRGVSESHHNLGIAYRDQGKLSDALHAADEAVRQATLAGDGSLRAQAIAGRAEIRTASGDADLAIREAQLASETHRGLNDPVREAEDQRILANALALAGRFDEAGSLLSDVIARAKTYSRPLLGAIAQRDLVRLEIRRGRTQYARQEAERARVALEELGARVEVEKLDRLLAGEAA
jgi:tetratricopeptide (TPR) repeat protein